MYPVCRICLAGNTRLYDVKNSRLIMLYEKLINSKFNAEDARTRALCSFCHQKLLRCHTFSQMALRSEKIISYIHDKGLKVTEVNLTLKQHLSVAILEPIIIDGNAGSHMTVKDDPPIQEVTTEPDTLVVEHSNENQLKLEDSDQGVDVGELRFEYHVRVKDEQLPIQKEVTTEPDILVVEHSNKSKLKPEDSAQGIDVGEPLFKHHVMVKDEPIHEEVTTEPDIMLFEHCNEIQLKLEEDSAQKVDVGEPLFKHHVTVKDEPLPIQEEVTTEPDILAVEYCNESQLKLEKDSKQRVAVGGPLLKLCNDKCSLNTHMRTRTGDKPFACNVCDKQFIQQAHIVMHMRTHTGEKPFSCNVCNKKYTQNTSLKLHMRTHTGEKPFSCNVCHKQFTQKCHLIIHNRTHTGEKPFACTVCDKQFSEKHKLVRHFRTHTGEKPFACNVCENKYNRKEHLDKHIKSHG